MGTVLEHLCATLAVPAGGCQSPLFGVLCILSVRNVLLRLPGRGGAQPGTTRGRLGSGTKQSLARRFGRRALVALQEMTVDILGDHHAGMSHYSEPPDVRQRPTSQEGEIGSHRAQSRADETGTQDWDDHVYQGGGVALEGRSPVTTPFQSGVVGQPNRAEPGPGGTGDVDVGGGLERFPVFAHLQDYSQAPVLQYPADLSFKREPAVIRRAGSSVRCAEQVGDYRDQGVRADSRTGGGFVIPAGLPARIVNGQVAVPAGGQVKVPSPRVC
jgi:hypothetical protein